MAHIPIDLPEQSVHIHAQRELVFEIVSAMGGSAGKSASESGESHSKPSSKVLEQEETRMLVEFTTPLKIGVASVLWKSNVWVTQKMPESIDFELVQSGGLISGGLRQLSDRFEFHQQGNCTVLTYKSRFGIRWSFGGWLIGKAVFAPIIKSHMAIHLSEVKEMIENRARRSRVYPQLACSELDDSGQDEAAKR